MTITTEEAEWLAKQHDLVRFTLGMKAPEHDLTAATIRSLAAERDALEAAVTQCRTLSAMLKPQADRIAELEAALQDAARVLHKAGEQFTEYANQHAAYKTAVSDLKAAANKEWAERCFNAHDAALEGGKQ